MITGTADFQQMFQNQLWEVVKVPNDDRNYIMPIVKTSDDSFVELKDKNINSLQQIRAQDSASVDAFGRWRVSENYTLFDSKQVWDNQPFLWDDQQTSGTGTSSVHYMNEAASAIGVSGSVAGTRVRQTFRRINYQPSKSQLILMTFAEFDTDTGITKRVGYFDDNNGLFFQSSNGTLSVVQRSSATGVPSGTVVEQSNWNLDKLDGTGESEITLDPEMSQIIVIDLEWLGVGRVRMGFVVNGLIYYCHEFLNANSLPNVYMSTPVLPLRYEISNDGTGLQNDRFMTICSAVMSEGGQENTGIVRHKHAIGIANLTTGNHYALIGVRLNPAMLGAAEFISISVVSSSANDLGHWMLVLNPTVAGTFNYSSEANSIIQTAIGTNANTITGGTQLDGGFFATAAPRTQLLKTELNLGAYIDGTPTTLVLSLIPLTANITISASIEWREP